MAAARSTSVTLRMSKDGAERLKATAKREKVSQSVLVERLLESTADDPNGYYLRAAAVHSWASMTLLTVLVNHTFGGSTPVVLENVEELSRGLFGPLPEVPKEASKLQRIDPRIKAILEAYGALK